MNDSFSETPQPSPDAEPPKAPPVSAPVAPDKDSLNLAMIAHLTGALVGFIGPLVIWLLKKDQNEFVEEQSREALNFQLTIIIGYLIAIAVTVISCGVIFFAPFIPWLLQIIFGIIAAVTTSKGTGYRYPMTIRFVR